MTNKELFNAMNYINDEYLEESENAVNKNRRINIKTYFILAACFTVIVTVSVLVMPLYYSVSTTESDEPSSSQINIECFYNLFENSAVSTLKIDNLGVFPEALEEHEVSAFIPKKLSSDEKCSFNGTAFYHNDGKLMKVELSKNTDNNVKLLVIISWEQLISDYLLPDKTYTVINGKNTVFYEYEKSDDHLLEAVYDDGGVFYGFRVEGNDNDILHLKETLEKTVYAYCCDDTDYSSLLKNIFPEKIPEYKNVKLTEKGVYENELFGKYFPVSLPDGFAFESAVRYKDYYNDYLRALWCMGLYDIRWRVSYYSESDMSRVTSVEETSNYDLSLYPIPRADSVPEELYEIVNDPIFKIEELTLEAVKARAYITESEEGTKMMFSVLIDDKLISISTKGASPEWVYNTLKSIKQ